MRLPMSSLLEGFVSQFLADYLSNYIKGIQPEQFRLGLWNGIAEFENVELRLEAFDYLQLPIAIREGIVGKLKIQVPWTKLGREPILIVLQDVYICACPRDEFEWKSEALEARSLAAKKAKLAAAELSKLSARISSHVSGNHSNQSFFSYVSTKLLDNMQVTVENVHFRYTDQKADPEMRFSVGIMFTHLNMNTDHTLYGVSSGKSRANLVNKIVDFRGFSVYWNCNENNSEEFGNYLNPQKWTYLIHPFDATARLMVNKNAPLDGNTPQYAMDLETNNLIFTLEDRQLHEMLLLWDALSICKMREKYGRHRPGVGQHGYNRKEDGWQKVWWHYVVQSVLVDVRRNLRRNSWSYLGWRMDMRRKYVVLYEAKLDSLSKGKPAAAETLLKLEELEKELDLEEILSFRSMAECNLKGQDLESKLQEESSVGQDDTKPKDTTMSEVKFDDQSSTKQRSWLNLLSMGMLGAAGSVAASEQFAGVVPDEIIEGIFEATKYFPSGMKGQGDFPKGLYRVRITCHISGALVTLRCLHLKEDIASLDLKVIEMIAKMWQHSANYLVAIKELKITDLSEKESAYPIVMGNEGMILPYSLVVGQLPRTYAEAVSGSQSKPSSAECLIVIEANVLSADEDFDIAVKIAMQPIEFVYSPTLMKQMSNFFDRPSSLQTLKDLISSSLDRLQSPQIRLQSKAELALSMGKPVSLKVEVQRPVIICPESMRSLDCPYLIIVMDSMQIRSKDQGRGPILNEATGGTFQGPNGFEQQSNAASEWFNETIYPAIYNQFEFELQHIEVILSSHSNWIDTWRGLNDKDRYYLAKPFDGSGILEICSLPDEPTLTRFKIWGVMPTLDITLSAKKWALLKSLFFNDTNGEASEFKLLNASTVSEVVGDENNHHPNLSSQDISEAVKFQLVLLPKRLSFSVVTHSEMDDSRTLHATGENASLLFTHSEHQQNLRFIVDSLNMNEVWHDHDAIFSLHSLSHLIVSASFEPTTVWEWDWMTSNVSTAFCIRDEHSNADIALMDFKDAKLFGSWRDGSLTSLKFKASLVRIKCATCQLDGNNFRSFSLCKEDNSWFSYPVEMQYCDDLLVCEPLDDVLGLDIDFFKGRECKQINMSMPFSKVNLHFGSWGRYIHVMSMFIPPSTHDAQENLQESSTNIMEPIVVPTQSQDSIESLADNSGLNDNSIVFKSSLICLLVCIPDYGQATSTKIKKSCLNGGHSMCSLTARHISFKTVFQVEKLCYKGSLSDVNASVHKCEINLIENIDETLQCIPLLRVADMQLSSNTVLKSNVKHVLNAGVTFLVKRLDVWCSHSVIQFLKAFRFEDIKSTDSNLEFDSVIVMGSLQRSSILLSDGRWNCNAPIFEVRMKTLNCQINWCPDKSESSTSMQIEVDYHDMEKVAWEPFLEPWDLSLNIMSNLKNNQVHELNFSSSSQLNINLTKHLLQASFRAMDLFSHSPQNLGFNQTPLSYAGYAPYWLQNDTGVCINYWLGGALKPEDYDGGIDGYGLCNVVQPGNSVPIHIEETMEQVFLKGRGSTSSDRLADKKAPGGQHRLIHIQIEGTSNVSSAMSMDLVGAHIFYVTFSHSSKSSFENAMRKGNSVEGKLSEKGDLDFRESAFCTPVVFEVSCHHYSKIIRIFSTVSLVNATSIPMEVRFDIPFGVLPKVMGPILPGNVVPLPVHLAETGQMRWRPMGNSHVWSEAQSLSHILTLPNQASVRSFVSYPVNPNNAIFRCCIMAQENVVTSVCQITVADQPHNLPTYSIDANNLDAQNLIKSKITNSLYMHSSTRILRDLVFQAPLLFKNCLPLPLTLTLESSAGLHLDIRILQGDSNFVLEVNPGQDLALTLNVPGFLPTKWPVQTAYVSLEDERPTDQNILLLVETLELRPDSDSGYTVYVKAESLFNVLSGARELTISVPFWFYNCTGVNLGIIDEDFDLLTMSNRDSKEHFVAFLSKPGTADQTPVEDCYGLQTVLQVPSPSTRLYMNGQFCGISATSSFGGGKNIISCESASELNGRICAETQNLKPYMYSPLKSADLGDKRLKARVAVSSARKSLSPDVSCETSWSRPFSLNPPGGVTTIVIPSSEPEGGLILSIVSASTMGASAGKTRTITFQPRFILANICNHDLCYRQQGSDASYHLLIGNQAHLLWSDMTRPLLVHVRFVEYGWDWSGAFAPDLLGDTQLKVRNLVTGATQVLRVEVQNAAFLHAEFNGISATDNSLGTYMIFLSEDEGGFMPYRIDNFSVERLRFYQIKCPDFESVLLPYSSCPYTWDEPWRPHHLVLEIPGEGCIGTFDLDEIKVHPRIRLPLTHQKPEREFLVSIHAEGAIRVLTFQDMNLHPLKNRVIKEGLPNQGLTYDSDIVYTFDLHFNFESVGLSIIDLSPQEILFASAKGVTVQLLQGSREEKLNINVSYIQIDNQLPLSQYPVMVMAGSYFPNERASGDRAGNILPADNTGVQFQSSAFTLAVSKWRNLASSVDCFQKIDVRLAPAQVQLDEHIVSCMVDFAGVLTGSAKQIVHLDGNLCPSDIGSQTSLNAQNYELLVDPNSTELHLIKILKWKEIYNSWPAPQAVKCVQTQNPKHFQGGRKVYIENLYIGPIDIVISFSSISWSHGRRGNMQSASLLWRNGGPVQRGLMALIDIEAAPIQMKQLSLAHPLARWDAIRGIIIKHYTRQLLHEIYKVLGSAGFLGNPMGFIRSLGSGVRDFVSVPAQSFVKSPAQLMGGFALGTQSLVSNTVFAVSNAATLMSRAARKGVTAFAMGHQQEREFQDYGVISELLEGLTGLLQSPVTGAQQHGIPGILSGIALGAVGLVARPVASILELAGRTAQSIRSWSQPIQQAKRIRPPRYISTDAPLLPYSWEEAIGHAVLREAVASRLQNEVYRTCRPLSEPGKYILLTEKLLLVVRSTDQSVSIGPEWIIDTEISIRDILYVERVEQCLNILRGSPVYLPRQKKLKKKLLSTSGPLLHESIELSRSHDAEEIAECINYLTDKHLKF